MNKVVILSSIAVIAFLLGITVEAIHTSESFVDDSERHMEDKSSDSVSEERDLQANIPGAISAAVDTIQNIINNDRTLAPKFIRLAFHDCIGICDGCVDLSNPDNNGLAGPINALSDLSELHGAAQTGLTRADIWALAAITGANHAKPDTDFYFKFRFHGRTNCENTGQSCLGFVGQDVGCTATTGPHRTMPPANADTEDILDFFNDEFGFTDQETTALMGVHTIGTASVTNSGFHGPSGWTTNSHILDNGYYKQITGSDQQLIDNAPTWRQRRINNAGLGISDRFQWERETDSGQVLMMLDSDISLVRSFGNNLNPFTGEVSCEFKGGNECSASKTIVQMGVYRNSNEQWMHDFRNVFQKMLVHGYTAVGCDGPTCLQRVVGYNPGNPSSGCRLGEGASNNLQMLLRYWIEDAWDI